MAWLLFALLSVQYWWQAVALAAQAPLWMDEVLALWVARQPDVPGVWAALVRGGEFNPPLYDLLLHGLGVTGTLALRLPSVVAGYGAALAIGVVGWRHGGRVAGLVAAGAVLASGLFGQAVQARPYAIVTCAMAGAVMLHDGGRGRCSLPRTLAIGGLLVLAIGCNFYALLPVGALALIEVARARVEGRRIDGGVLAAVGAAGASIALWWPILAAARAYSAADTGAPGYYARPTIGALAGSYGVLAGWLVVPLIGLIVAVLVGRGAHCAIPDRAEPFDFARDRLVEASSSLRKASRPRVEERCFDKLSTNGEGVGLLASDELLRPRLRGNVGRAPDAALWAIALVLLAVPAGVWGFAVLVSHSHADRYTLAGALGLALVIAGLVRALGARAGVAVLAGLLVAGAWRDPGEIGKVDRADAFAAVVDAPGTLPIVTGSGLRFLELREGAPTAIARRMVFADVPRDGSPDPTNRNQVRRWHAIRPDLPVVDARRLCGRSFLLFAQARGGGADPLPGWVAARVPLAFPAGASLTPVRNLPCSIR